MFRSRSDIENLPPLTSGPVSQKQTATHPSTIAVNNTTTPRKPLSSISSNTPRKPLSSISSNTPRKPLSSLSSNTPRKPLAPLSANTPRKPFGVLHTNAQRKPLAALSTNTRNDVRNNAMGRRMDAGKEDIMGERRNLGKQGKRMVLKDVTNRRNGRGMWERRPIVRKRNFNAEPDYVPVKEERGLEVPMLFEKEELGDLIKERNRKRRVIQEWMKENRHDLENMEVNSLHSLSSDEEEEEEFWKGHEKKLDRLEMETLSLK